MAEARISLTRRQVVAGLASSAAMSASIVPALAKSSSSAKGKIMVPKNAVDTHVHVFDPKNFPYSPGRRYTPGTATVAELVAFERSIGVDRVVLVQPSPYGNDNSCLLSALRQLGPAKARGVAVIDPATVTAHELDTLKTAGVVAVRVNLTVKNVDDASAAAGQIEAAIRRVSDVGLGIQIYLALHLVEPIIPVLRDSPVPIILDHYAGANAALGPQQQGFTTLLRALERGKLWVKLSANYRASTLTPDYPDVAPLAQAMIRTNPERLIWASDWPHTGGGAERQGRKATDVEPFRKVDEQRSLELLREWSGNEATYRRILVDNPSNLFGFK